MKHRTVFVLAAALSCACGAASQPSQALPQAVRAAPAPSKLLAWVAAELQDSLMTTPVHAACITQAASTKSADDATATEATPTQVWRYNACLLEDGHVSVSGERHLWTHEDASGTKVRTRFDMARSRADGTRWSAQGQTEVVAQRGPARVERVLTHGTAAVSVGQSNVETRHDYAYHVRVTRDVDGANTHRVDGVAQLNFATLGITSQVKIVSMLQSPNCTWPTFGHVSIASTASDGSMWDDTLAFTQGCGVVQDAQGGLTVLAMPWEEGL